MNGIPMSSVVVDHYTSFFSKWSPLMRLPLQIILGLVTSTPLSFLLPLLHPHFCHILDFELSLSHCCLHHIVLLSRLCLCHMVASVTSLTLSRLFHMAASGRCCLCRTLIFTRLSNFLPEKAAMPNFSCMSFISFYPCFGCREKA